MNIKIDKYLDDNEIKSIVAEEIRNSLREKLKGNKLLLDLFHKVIEKEFSVTFKKNLAKRVKDFIKEGELYLSQHESVKLAIKKGAENNQKLFDKRIEQALEAEKDLSFPISQEIGERITDIFIDKLTN